MHDLSTWQTFSARAFIALSKTKMNMIFYLHISAYAKVVYYNKDGHLIYEVDNWCVLPL